MNSESTVPTRSRWQTSKSLARSAWRVLKLDSKLAGIPLLSAAVTLIVAIAAGAIVLMTSNFNVVVTPNASSAVLAGPLSDPSWISALFYITVYLTLTFIGTYFSAALVAGLLQRFRGETPTVRSSLAAARAHIGPLLRFSIVTGTIGYILQAIEERVPLAGKIATTIAGAAWSVASMFAVPVIVSDKGNIGPFAATRRSVDVIKKTWGETVILSAGIGLVSLLSIMAFMATFVLIGILTASVVSAAGASGTTVGMSVGVVGVVGIIGLIGLTLLFTVLSAVVKAAIFHYATTGEAPEGFERDILRASFTPKKARGIFAS